MLDSYFEEIKNKRRKNLFFWLIVLIFAIILFFFFKGKYISLNVNWKNFLAGSGSLLEQKNISHTGETSTGSQFNSIISLHSFGIVNVKVAPKNAEILLNKKPYINDSKPQVDYGKYELEINHPEYLSGAMNFQINDAKNFYIDDISMLKKPDYKKFTKITDSSIISLGNDFWLNNTASGMILYKDNFLTGSLAHSKNFTHIGGGKFLNGKNLTEFDTSSRTWTSETFHPIVKNFVKTCENPSFKNNLYFCGDDSIMTPTGQAFSGFIDSGKNFIKYENRILLGNISENNLKNFSLTGSTLAEVELSNNFIEINGNWYNIDAKKSLENDEKSGTGVTFFRMDGKIDEKTPIELELDSVSNFIEHRDKIFFFGETSSGKMLAVTTMNKNESTQYFEFPDIDLTDMRIYEKDGNFFIKTTHALLFFYRGWNEIKWIIDGKILAIGKDFALYEKEDGVWIADWTTKTTSTP